MSRNKQRTKSWAIVAIVNIAAILYPMNRYSSAGTIEQQISGLLLLVGTALVLAVVDTVSALIAYS